MAWGWEIGTLFIPVGRLLYKSAQNVKIIVTERFVLFTADTQTQHLKTQTWVTDLRERKYLPRRQAEAR